MELFYTLGGLKCAAARKGVRAAALQVVPDITWREINVLEEFDYAVELGALTLPSVAINGELVFSSLPTLAQLSKELRRCLAQGAADGH